MAALTYQLDLPVQPTDDTVAENDAGAGVLGIMNQRQAYEAHCHAPLLMSLADATLERCLRPNLGELTSFLANYQPPAELLLLETEVVATFVCTRYLMKCSHMHTCGLGQCVCVCVLFVGWCLYAPGPTRKRALF